MRGAEFCKRQRVTSAGQGPGVVTDSGGRALLSFELATAVLVLRISVRQACLFSVEALAKRGSLLVKRKSQGGQLWVDNCPPQKLNPITQLQI